GASVGRAAPPGAGLRRALHPATRGERRGTPLAALLDDLHRLPGSLEAEDGPHALLLGAQILLVPLPHRLLEDGPDLRQVGETILGRTEVETGLGDLDRPVAPERETELEARARGLGRPDLGAQRGQGAVEAAGAGFQFGSPRP